MSEYQAKCTTNTFRVKDIEDLKDSLEFEGFRVVTDSEEFDYGTDAVLLEVRNEALHEVTLYAGGEYGMWPDLYDYVAEEEHGGLSGVTGAVTENLQADSVAVFTEVGADAWDLNGYTVAINAKGESLDMHLSDIVNAAHEKFGGVVRA